MNFCTKKSHINTLFMQHLDTFVKLLKISQVKLKIPQIFPEQNQKICILFHKKKTVSNTKLYQ